MNTINMHLKIPDTAEFYSLYRDVPGVNAAAQDIAKAIAESWIDLNGSAIPKSVYEVLEKYSHLGAFDTEPCDIIGQLYRKLWELKVLNNKFNNFTKFP